MDDTPTSRNADGVYEPFPIADVPWTEASRGSRFAMRFQHLSQFGGASQVGVAMEILPPGMQANQARYHLLEEEHVLVLEGQLTLLLGERTYAMGPDDYVCFPAGQRVGHALVNRGDQPCRYLIIGSRHPHDVSVHTETGRVSVKLTGEGYRGDAVQGYWDGVDVGAAP